MSIPHLIRQIRTTDATLNSALDTLGAIVNGQVLKVSPLEANRILTYLRELESLAARSNHHHARSLQEVNNNV